MARQPLVISKRLLVRAAFLGLLALALPGCVMTENWVTKKLPTAPEPVISQVILNWGGMGVTQDTVNKGQPLPGLVGRMYLIGPDLVLPTLATGRVIVDMYVPQPDGSWKKAPPWNIDPQTLQRLAKKDIVGEGYTLFLPLTEYDPSIAHVKVQASFIPKSGVPVYSQPNMVHMRPQGFIPIQEEQTIGNSRPAAPVPSGVVASMPVPTRPVEPIRTK